MAKRNTSPALFARVRRHGSTASVARNTLGLARFVDECIRVTEGEYNHTINLAA